ncbi:MAG: dihydroorotate dehydrogenase electron transfer subunit [Deltaproteobacteria bacterium]
MKKKIFQKKFKVVANDKISGDYFKITLEAADIARAARPGQFLMLRPDCGSEPLLRRPLGVHSVKKDKIDILYEVVGKGTVMLSKKRPDDYIDAIGPLGNGFELNALGYGTTPVLIAGGMGVAPLFFLAEKIMERKAQRATPARRPAGKTLVILGAKTKSTILCENKFIKLGCEVKVSTDDGSKGFKGTAVSLLKQALSTIDYRQAIIYACGPQAMLKELSYFASKRRITAFGSFEEHMACGFGACLGCVIKVMGQSAGNKNEFLYKRVCKDGPVFALSQIVWRKD